jgi:uncharacterized peroxidase-related enzyme
MSYLPISGLTMVEEDQAPPEVAEIYNEFKRHFQIPIAPNSIKTLGISPATLATYWDFTCSFYQRITLPEALTSMILFTIAERRNCKYCSANHELTCRSLGIDEATLAALVKDLDNVSPLRIRTIIQFALKAADHAQELVAEDYDRVREQGVTDEELVEIIHVVAVANYLDTLADATKLEVDSIVTQALGS